MFKQLHIFVSGRVQGVFFRAYTEKEAKKLGLTGWVRNLDDGRVEILAEGEDSVLQKLLDWCDRGSPDSRVDKVEYDWLDFYGKFDDFNITH